MSRKTFVLDTSVLIYDPKAYTSFQGNNVILPITILDELDKLKKLGNESGKNARVAIRGLDVISKKGEIHDGIEIENDIMLKIDASVYGSIGSDASYGDNKILACASKINEHSLGSDVILVSKDINLRTRARAFGILAEDYEKDKIHATDLYMGHRIINDKEAGLELFTNGSLSPKNYKYLADFYPNECVLFTDENKKGVAPGRMVKNKLRVINDKTPWGLELRNKEQLFAAELILDPSIHLVSIIGSAGTGKTLTAVACALELVLNQKRYDSIVIYRPIQPMGNDIGYTPGSIEEKLDPWFVPIDDAFAFLFADKSRNKNGWKSQLHQYMDNGTIQKCALTYIRGRSIPNSLIILDEAQNISKAEMKTILTRAGNNSKLIINGDIEQIDNSYLDAENNGLSYAVERFKETDLAGHITFTKGERSAIATLASEIL